MQEKDIKEKLNQELDKMAPDILEKVLAKPIEPIESEEDLFNNEPLFEEKRQGQILMDSTGYCSSSLLSACSSIVINLV